MKNKQEKPQKTSGISCPYWNSVKRKCEQKQNMGSYCEYSHRAIICPLYLNRDTKPKKNDSRVTTSPNKPTQAER